MQPLFAIVALWICFIASWMLAASWRSPAEKSVGWRGEIGYRAVLILGGVLLAIPAHRYDGPLRLWHPGWTGAWASVGVIALGFGFSWWARLHLGTLWSGQITKKADHRVIDTGPYGIVRHPIYTGILLAVYATVVAKGTILAVLAGIVITIGLWMKARLEEGWLRRELGPEAYDAYRRRVPMLLPFGPKAAAS
jgi:protein-S-isoprenylcysteine O-methyltransferase Ste14